VIPLSAQRMLEEGGNACLVRCQLQEHLTTIVPAAKGLYHGCARNAREHLGGLLTTAKVAQHKRKAELVSHHALTYHWVRQAGEEHQPRAPEAKLP
jgi:hypothetical protein